MESGISFIPGSFISKGYSFWENWEMWGVIATFIAVVVALFANKQALDGFKDALRIQNQNKDIELYEKRLSLLKGIIDNEDRISFEVSILFSEKDSIQDLFHELCTIKERQQEVAQLVKEFVDRTCDEDGKELVGYSRIKEAEAAYLNYPDDPSLEQAFITTCKENTITLPVEWKDEPVVLDYYELYNEGNQLVSKYEEKKGRLCQEIEKYITDSIKDFEIQ